MLPGPIYLFETKPITMKPGNFTLPFFVSPYSILISISRFSLPVFLLLFISHSQVFAARHPTVMPSGGSETMRTNLYLLNDNGSTVLADGVLAEYHNNYHDGFTLEDARKFTNIRENLGLNRYGTILAIERRPLITTEDTLFFKLWKTTRRNYQLEFIANNLEHPGLQAYLEDAYLNTNTPLLLNGTTKVSFTINPDAASANVDRFRIIYQTPFALVPLPVQFTNIKGYELNNRIFVEWEVANEANLEAYEVERSGDGAVFQSVQRIAPNGTNRPIDNYSITDEAPLAGNNFYRVKSIDRDGTKKYSTVVRVAINKKQAGAISIYPNPIRGNRLNIQFINTLTGEYRFRLINQTGQVVYVGKLQVNSGNTTQTLSTNSNLSAGIYRLEITSPDKSVLVKQAVVQE